MNHATASFGSISVVSGVQRAAEDAGYGITLASLSAFSPGDLQEAVDRLVRTGCAGVVIVAPWASDAKALCQLRCQAPVVTTSQVPGYAGPAAHPDTERAAGDMTDYLLSLGHRSVWHVGGPTGWDASGQRRHGWERALRAGGALVPTVLPSDWSARSGYQAGLKLARIGEVTAVSAVNDQVALGVTYALAKAGLRVPEDMSVVGYDNEPGSDFYRPAVTTVKVDNLDHGRQAVRQLIRQFEGEVPDASASVRHELIIGKSAMAPSK